MNAGSGASARLTQTEEGQDVAAGQLGMGLQLLRASTLTMTRLNLALQSGDRRLAMMAMDGLLDIDAEIEAFVADLVRRPDNDAHWQALSGYLEHQKAAIAVEKHALSGVVGRVDAPAVAHAIVEEFPVSPPPAEAFEPITLTDDRETPRPWWSWRGVSLILIGLLAALIVAALAVGLR